MRIKVIKGMSDTSFISAGIAIIHINNYDSPFSMNFNLEKYKTRNIVFPVK
jgi:hypothetical protein